MKRIAVLLLAPSFAVAGEHMALSYRGITQAQGRKICQLYGQVSVAGVRLRNCAAKPTEAMVEAAGPGASAFVSAVEARVKAYYQFDASWTGVPAVAGLHYPNEPQ